MAEINTAEKVLEIARGYLGTADGDIFTKKYNEITGAGIPLGSDWCAMFVTCIARMAAVPATEIPNYAGCSTGRRLFERLGRWKNRTGYTPKAGDVIFYDWDIAAGNGEDHTGIVEAVQGQTVFTIEGNARNGVCMKNSSALSSSFITGYGVPVYAKGDDDVTEAQVTAMIQAQAKKIAETAIGSYFAALEKRACPGWAKPAVQYCIDQGYIQGDGKTAPTVDNVRPMDLITRAEACQIIYNAKNKG